MKQGSKLNFQRVLAPFKLCRSVYTSGAALTGHKRASSFEFLARVSQSLRKGEEKKCVWGRWGEGNGRGTACSTLGCRRYRPWCPRARPGPVFSRTRAAFMGQAWPNVGSTGRQRGVSRRKRKTPTVASLFLFCRRSFRSSGSQPPRTPGRLLLLLPLNAGDGC